MKLICGMHRSGTSLVARLFLEAGADMGNPNTFYKPDAWNPDGYFEQIEMQSLHRGLVNGPLGRLSYFRLPSKATLMRRSLSLADEISRLDHEYANRVVKEVRYCLTLPVWLKHGGHIDRMLICLREPEQVALSIRRRNRISMRRAYRLWYTHLRRLMEELGDIPHRFIRYKYLLDPEFAQHEIKGALEFFELQPGQERVKELSEVIVKPEMNHAVQKSVELPQNVAELWEDLVNRHARQYCEVKPLPSEESSPVHADEYDKR